MILAASESIGISRQRGFWLRCFLGRMLIPVSLVIVLGGTAHANVCVYKTMHVRSVHGYVVDSTLERVPNARVIAKSAGKVVVKSTTDQKGSFRLKLPRGEYDLKVEATGFAPGYARVKVGFGFRSLIHPNTLRFTVSPGVICQAAKAEGHRIAA